MIGKKAAAYFAKFNQPIDEMVRLAASRGYENATRAQIEDAADVLYHKKQVGFQIDPIDHVYWIWDEAERITVFEVENARAQAVAGEIAYWKAEAKKNEDRLQELEHIVAKLTKDTAFKRIWRFLTKKRYFKNASTSSKV